MVTSSYTMVEDYSMISHLPLHQSSHLPTDCKSQSRGYISHSPDYISHSPAYISHTPSSSACKRKLPNEYDSYHERPPKQRIYSMMYNTPKQHRNECKQMLRMAVKKLRAIDNPETNLCRSVLINNTVKRLRDDIKEEKRNGFLKIKLSKHYSMDYNNCDITRDDCDRAGDIKDSHCDTKDSMYIVSDVSDVKEKYVETINSNSTSHQGDDTHNEHLKSQCTSQSILHSTSQSMLHRMPYSTYHSMSHLTSQSLPISPSTPHTVSDFAYIAPDDPQPIPKSAGCPGYNVTKGTMMSYPDPVVMDTSDSEEFIDIMTVDDEYTPLDLSVTITRTYETPGKHANNNITSFAERVCAERLESKPFHETSHAEQHNQIATNESSLTNHDRLILSDMEAVFNKIMNVISDSCHGGILSHEIPTFMSEIPIITSSS